MSYKKNDLVIVRPQKMISQGICLDKIDGKVIFVENCLPGELVEAKIVKIKKDYLEAKTEHVTIKVYNVLGKEIATLVDEMKEPGVYSVRFDASNLSSGIYFYKFQSESYNAVKKMILQK